MNVQQNLKLVVVFVRGEAKKVVKVRNERYITSVGKSCFYTSKNIKEAYTLPINTVNTRRAINQIFKECYF